MDWILHFSGEKSKKSTPWRQQNSKDSICIVVGISVKVFKNGGQLVSFLYSEQPFHIHITMCYYQGRAAFRTELKNPFDLQFMNLN